MNKMLSNLIILVSEYCDPETYLNLVKLGIYKDIAYQNINPDTIYYQYEELVNLILEKLEELKTIEILESPNHDRGTFIDLEPCYEIKFLLDNKIYKTIITVDLGYLVSDKIKYPFPKGLLWNFLIRSVKNLIRIAWKF